MKRFRVQQTLVWYEDYEWEKSEHDYYDSEEEYIEAVTTAIQDDGYLRLDYGIPVLDYSRITVEVEDA